ncbi:MAG: hypothetical protein IT432_10055 [Phycisphaerales bacterium]|nr:hypothetical protein [Phycisphaerales bacterium]
MGKINGRWLATLTLATLASVAGTYGSALAGAPAMPRAAITMVDEDTLIFKDGKVVTGKILKEDATTIKFKGSVGGIEFEADYKKDDILEIKRAKVDPKGEKPKPADTKPADDKSKAPAAKEEPVAPSEGGVKYYTMELSGHFGWDISQTPIRDCMKEAVKGGADYVIVIMNNDWSQGPKELSEDRKPEDAAFDELFRAEDMDDIFSTDLRSYDKPPKVVFWVKRAMGGGAFLPLVCPTMYFSSDGKLGGIGNLTKLFGGTGDEVVRQKQYSLRLKHAEGIANTGGYSIQLLRAMAIPEFVLTVAYPNGDPVLYERMPEGPGEFLLTDDGMEANSDTAKALEAGEGNDVLTLTAKLAQDLRVSKGTVDDIDQLKFELGISRSGVEVKSRAKQIMEGWSKGLEQAMRDLRRLRGEANAIQLGGDFTQRTRARGQKKQILQKMQGILKKYGEVFGEERRLGMDSDLQREIDLLDHDQTLDLQQQRRKK